MWAWVVKRLSRFFTVDGVSRGVGAAAAAARKVGERIAVKEARIPGR